MRPRHPGLPPPRRPAAPPPAPPVGPAWRALQVGPAREADRGRALPQVSAFKGRCATGWGGRVHYGLVDLTPYPWPPLATWLGSPTLGRGG